MRQTRKRVCYDPSNEEAMGCESKGPAQEERICGDAICPKPPSWGNWGPWESCSSACKEEREGHQLRRRLCLDDRRSGLTCATNPPKGPSVQRQRCLAESCGSNTNFGSWEEWGPCDLSCAPRDGKTTGVQLRTRECVGDICSSLDESVTKQFRVCPDISLCFESPCHDDWWKEKSDGPFFFGCTDTDDSGTFWCPLPGGVDEKSIASSPSMIHTCSQTEIEKARSKRMSTDTSKERCPHRALIDCKDDPEGTDEAYCKAVKYMYSNTKKEVKKQKKLDKKEDIGFLKMLIPLVGWSPLDSSESYYITPILKFEFYQDVLNQLDKFAPECHLPTTHAVRRRMKPNKSRFCAMDQDCSQISQGKDTFSSIVQKAVDKLNKFSKELDKITRDYAKAKVANAAIATTAGVVGVVTAVVGVVCGKSLQFLMYSNVCMYLFHLLPIFQPQ
jgi:hypothetical protein